MGRKKDENKEKDSGITTVVLWPGASGDIKKFCVNNGIDSNSELIRRAVRQFMGIKVPEEVRPKESIKPDKEV